MSVNLYHEEQARTPEDDAVSGNLFAPILGLVGISLLACMVSALGLADRQSGDALSHCGSIPNDRTRLACYDKLAGPRHPAKGALAPLHRNQYEQTQ
jgi:hypothetical protein